MQPGWLPTGAELVTTLELDEETPSNNVIKNMHHFEYRNTRKRWAMRVFVALGGRRPKQPIERAFLVIRRECAGEGLDWDNAYGGLKPLLDCLVSPTEKRNPDGLGVIRDDKLRNMPYPPFVQQVKGVKGKGRTTVQVYALPDE